uniref:Secreted protein n=1 Tax=Acrobeloides nanus TaxID=290746 RepID=A0A914EFT8_9BILA
MGIYEASLFLSGVSFGFLLRCLLSRREHREHQHFFLSVHAELLMEQAMQRYLIHFILDGIAIGRFHQPPSGQRVPQNGRFHQPPPDVDEDGDSIG